LLEWFKSLFVHTYTLPQSCAGCVAHRMHIEDLQNLLKSERESYASLLAMVVPGARQTPAQTEQPDAEMKPLRNNLSISQLRRLAEQKERETHPNANKEYWERVQADYDKAGKLPTVEVNG